MTRQGTVNRAWWPVRVYNKISIGTHLGVCVTAMASGTRLRHHGLYWGGVLPSPCAIQWREDIVYSLSS